MARLDDLAAAILPFPDTLGCIVMEVIDAHIDAPPYTRDSIIGLRADDAELTRLPGESFQALHDRAAAVPPRVAGAVRVWFCRYQNSDLAEIPTAADPAETA
ncbi:MAG: hypothetical protein EPN31_12135 [Castellaniella sp.]|uniref:hypothetical protein n=1 Tax=Castellaniella sp. TaxID=1955812 RepID=UPI00121D0C01|nr:hypothetical protein [Castellaniella sp.]TAN27277.1 MAG: hypothetical protein EPN31_12135 [Castellaniella sp.]